MMNKYMKKLLLLAGLMSTLAISAVAEQIPGGDNWSVSFTPDKKMVSNFGASDMDDSIYGLQPGDYTDIELALKNENENTTDWYMLNEVLNSLEDTRDSESLSGGAYTYILKYYDKNGTERVLFSSDTVGGEDTSEAGVGLHEATDALKDYLYLDTLKQGESGKLTLRVALDGETQGNDYQDTLADLRMKFAVELNKLEEGGGESDKKDNKSSGGSSSTSSRRTTSQVVRTGDYTDSLPYVIAAGISGIVLLFIGIYSMRERRRQKEGR